MRFVTKLFFAASLLAYIAFVVKRRIDFGIPNYSEDAIAIALLGVLFHFAFLDSKNSLKRWLHWFFVRPWPVWALSAATLVVAFGANWTVTGDGPGFNKIAGASLQAVGALIVLISLDGNVGLFKGRGILSEVLKWAHDYPKEPKHIILEASASCQSNSSASATLTIRPGTMEERVEELERVVVDLRSLISTRHNELTSAIAATRNEARDASTRIAGSLRELETKVIVSAVGGLKAQSFGVGLALLGSVLSVFS